MLKYNILMIMKKLDSSVKHWNDIVYYVPYCNVRTAIRVKLRDCEQI
ncbi:hypothetical protein [Wolbachia endosymbiont (group A) of Cydia splendana]|nr:hypothetical protein [Wolbachia endosymbiont (group A) of Cydia splendana]